MVSSVWGRSWNVVYYVYLFQSLFRRAMAVCSRPLHSDARVRSQVPPSFMVDWVVIWQNFLPVHLFPPISITPPLLHTHLYLYVYVIRRTSGRRMGTSQKNVCFFFCKRVELIWKVLPDVTVRTKSVFLSIRLKYFVKLRWKYFTQDSCSHMQASGCCNVATCEGRNICTYRITFSSSSSSSGTVCLRSRR